jgi:hypothetical protein
MQDVHIIICHTFSIFLLSIISIKITKIIIRYARCIYYLGVVKQSSAMIMDLTDDQGVFMIVRAPTYHFKAAKQVHGMIMDM